MENRILVCGNHSFVATGLMEKLIINSFGVDGFTRGDEKRNVNQVSGNVLEISKNSFLSEEYDVVINMIVLKDQGIEENIAFVKELVELCKIKKVKRLIHFSSIMVYDNNEAFIDETTEIEKNTFKTGYGAVKIAVDYYLMSLTNLPFSISFIRPGYVLAVDRPCPFVKKLPFGITIVKGDKNSKQPIVKRDDIHQALLNMITYDPNQSVYLFVPNIEMTKYDYAKEHFGGILVPLPKWFILGFSKLFLRMNLIKKSFYVRIEGMYIESKYNSKKTEEALTIKF
jgi:nucleoside-diphosphate-sugar epimerase